MEQMGGTGADDGHHDHEYDGGDAGDDGETVDEITNIL